MCLEDNDLLIRMEKKMAGLFWKMRLFWSVSDVSILSAGQVTGNLQKRENIDNMVIAALAW